MVPRAFVSYSWDSDAHRRWVRDFATRLRRDGVDAALDQWHAIPGDQLTAFMEAAIRENDFVLIVCTPRYKEKADKRTGGVGYEGGVMTAELFVEGRERKFIPILRNGSWADASPSWLAGKYFINLSGNPYSDNAYNDLLDTLFGTRPSAPTLGSREATSATKPIPKTKSPALGEVTVLLNPCWSPNKPMTYDEKGFEEFDEIQLWLESIGFQTEEIDEPKNASIFPLIEYSPLAARTAMELRDKLLPIFNKYRKPEHGGSMKVEIRKRRARSVSGDGPNEVPPRLWLHL